MAAQGLWRVFINHEAQYGLLPDHVEAPDGWVSAGFSGTEDECVQFVDANWTDMRPLSLRRAMEADAGGRPVTTQA